MNFVEALKLLAEGKRVISKSDKEIYDQQWLMLDDQGCITYMNEPWVPTPEWLLAYMNAEWINVEEDCDYHDHADDGQCRKD